MSEKYPKADMRTIKELRDDFKALDEMSEADKRHYANPGRK